MNKNPTENDEKMPLILTFKRTLPDLRHIINKNQHILLIEGKLKDIFKKPPVFAFKRNKNLLDFIGGNKVYNYKKLIHAKTFDLKKYVVLV